MWRQLPQPPAGFGKSMGLPALHARLLYNRGVRRKVDVDPFLALDERLLHDPGLLPHVDAAVEMIARTSQRGGSVAIYGDFDVDGVSATALLCRTVRDLGGNPVPYIPNRMTEGHGLNEAALRKLASAGVDLVVTVDCGTTAAVEVRLARSLGMDVVITDHHVAQHDVPEDVPVVNPGLGIGLEDAYPYTGLTGVGVAFKLAQAAYASVSKTIPEAMLELAALGTVADVGPLTGENRYLVGRGLESLRRTETVGISALAKRGKIDLRSMDARGLSFGLIPRLNAAGRMDDPAVALRLLTTENAEEAEGLADRLEGFNDARRRATQEGVREAEEMVEAGGLASGPAMVVHSPDWHSGIVGLIAGRLSERYGRPVVAGILTDGEFRASARAPAGSNVIEAMEATGLPFLRIGGHAQAAGFALDRQYVDEFERLFLDRLTEMGSGPVDTDVVDYDCVLELSAVNEPNYAFIASLAPFGVGNPAPMFMTRGARVIEARTVGRTDAHLKLRLSGAGHAIEAIAFGHGPRFGELGQMIDLVYSVSENDWGGRRRLELKVEDFRPAR